jgi:large subunit ribosomal protein L19
MQSVIQKVEYNYMKKKVVDVKTGDQVKVHQKIKEGNKERIQIFDGMVIRTGRKKSLTSTITVRRISGGVGVEKSFLLHSPNVLKIDVVKRSKVRRNFLSYMRKRTGKSTRLAGVDFDRKSVNTIHDEEAEKLEEKMREEAEKEHELAEAEKAKEAATEEKKFEEAVKSHDLPTKAVAPEPK